jgi:hypothetical protein
VLKKLTAAGILAAAASGVVLFSGAANADLLAGHRTVAPATGSIVGCYAGQVYYQPAWCTNAPPVGVYPGYQGYPGYHLGWDRWHHRNWPGRVYFRR